jgi:hypothetical protein
VTSELEPIPPWAEKLVRWLDDFVRVPGTRIGIGLDAIIGFLLPGAGDALTGAGSLALLFLALRSGVPKIALVRMIGNILIDTLLGAVPVVGDLFDVAWKANRKNLEIIQRYRGDPTARPGAGEVLLVGIGVLLVLLSIALPVLLLLLLGTGLASLLGQ